LRLGILSEGKTERGFVRDVLRPHLEIVGIRVEPPILKVGGGGRGGAVNLDRVVENARKLSFNFDTLTTMFDWNGFAGHSAASADELEAELERRVGRENFFAYVQVHDFEALLFADPAATAQAFEQPDLADRMSDILRQCGEPETINSRLGPSRRLIGLAPQYDGAKPFLGPAAASKAGLAKLRDRCPRFAQWIARLESLRA
jgi:hypothetical protein